MFRPEESTLAIHPPAPDIHSRENTIISKIVSTAETSRRKAVLKQTAERFAFCRLGSPLGQGERTVRP